MCTRFYVDYIVWHDITPKFVYLGEVTSNPSKLFWLDSVFLGYLHLYPLYRWCSGCGCGTTAAWVYPEILSLLKLVGRASFQWMQNVYLFRKLPVVNQVFLYSWSRENWRLSITQWHRINLQLWCFYSSCLLTLPLNLNLKSHQTM